MIPSSESPIGIIAGGGQLPNLLIDACRDQQRPYTVIALTGAADAETLIEQPALWMRLGDAAQGFALLNRCGVQDVVMAGHVKRPTLADLFPDWRTAQFLARVGTRAFLKRESVGDDRLLRSIIEEIELEGFVVVGIESVLSDLLVEAGALGSIQSQESDREDIEAGFLAAKTLGQEDKGQAVVVDGQTVLAKEGAAGTDALIDEAGSSKADGQHPLLVKVSKPNQDRRADLPAIGPETVTACSNAGFRGIAIEAQGTLVIDRDEVARRADDANMFVVAIDPGSTG